MDTFEILPVALIPTTKIREYHVLWSIAGLTIKTVTCCDSSGFDPSGITRGQLEINRRVLPLVVPSEPNWQESKGVSTL